MASLGSYKLQRFRQAFGDTDADDASVPERGATLAKIAELLGVTKMMISYLENGQRTPSLKLALKIEELEIAEVGDWHQPAPASSAAA